MNNHKQEERINKTNTMLLFHSPYRLTGEAIDLMYRSFPRSLPQKEEPAPGQVIWCAHQGPMRIHTGPRLTKAEKKAAKKDRIYRNLLPEIFERMRTTIKN